MKIKDAINIIEQNNLEALVWSFDDCPLQELKKVYVPRGKEELVVLTYKGATYIPHRLTFSEDPYDVPPYVTLSLDEIYHAFIVFNEDMEELPHQQESENSLRNYINFIESNKLPGLIWNFSECPLDVVKNFEGELAIEKNGEIKNAIRCYVILHKNGEGDEIIPKNMIDEFEEFQLEQNYKITIPIMISEYYHDDNTAE
jgi:hypothetical protein